MSGFFALNREATSPSEQAMFWGACWCGLMLTAVYAALLWFTGEPASLPEIAWRGAVVVLLLLTFPLGIKRYRRSGTWKHVLMQCLLAIYTAVAALSAVGAIGLPSTQLLVLGSAVVLLFFMLPIVLPRQHGSAAS